MVEENQAESSAKLIKEETLAQAQSNSEDENKQLVLKLLEQVRYSLTLSYNHKAKFSLLLGGSAQGAK